jgi:hypothetical protein
MSPPHRDVHAELRAWLVSDEVVGPAGALHAWYDADTDERAFAYPEITGYALTHLTGLADASRPEREVARRATDWLVGRVEAGNLAARDGWENDGIYYFDLAIMANGLFNAAAAFESAEPAHAAEILIDVLVTEIERTGHLPAIPAGQPTGRSGWSVTGRAHMGKALQALAHAGVHGDARVMNAAQAVRDATMSEQQPDGRFRTDERDEVTMLHPHLYAVEGLWCYASATADASAADRARTAAEWVWRHQLPSGGLPRYVGTSGGDPGPEQLDLTAQAVRAAHLTGTTSPAARRATERLLALTVDRGSGRRALPYQPDAPEHHLNTWTTLFAVQALDLVATDATMSWRRLV